MKREIITTLLAFVVASCIATGLLVLRVLYSGSPAYLFLLWNLFLAWLPLLAALPALTISRYPPLLVAWGGLWLLFLPNAPYILTDLIHLRRWNDVPVLYDLVLVLTYAFTGLLLGFASLSIMQTVVSDKWGRATGWIFAITSLTLSSMGVYIGRFLRWNSWDALLQPFDLMLDLLRLLRDPWMHKSAYVFTLLLSALLAFAYVTLRTFPQQWQRIRR